MVGFAIVVKRIFMTVMWGTMNQQLFNAAMKYIHAGIAAIPVWPDRRKNPKLSSYLEYRERLPTLDEWARWATRWPEANIALLTGYHAGLCALDFDSTLDYDIWLQHVKPKWLQTWITETGRGKHVYFFSDNPGHDRSYTLGATTVLLRAQGAYIIAPPSIHHTGKPYRTVTNLAPVRASAAQILAGWQQKNEVQGGGRQPVQPLLHWNRHNHHRLDILDWIQPYGNHKPDGKAVNAFCPFHDDNHPSAWVNPDQNRFGCNNPDCPAYGWHDVINVIALSTGHNNADLMRNYRRRGNPLDFG